MCWLILCNVSQYIHRHACRQLCSVFCSTWHWGLMAVSGTCVSIPLTPKDCPDLPVEWSTIHDLNENLMGLAFWLGCSLHWSRHLSVHADGLAVSTQLRLLSIYHSVPCSVLYLRCIISSETGIGSVTTWRLHDCAQSYTRSVLSVMK